MANMINLRATVEIARNTIRSEIKRVEKKIITPLGMRYMHYARRAVENAPKGKAAEKGKPFHAHPAKGRPNIKRAIQWAHDPAMSSIVIGPAWAQELYERHEYGEQVQLVNKRRKREKRVGDVGILVRGRTNKRRKKRDGKSKGGPAYAVNPVDRKSEWEGGAKIKEPVLYAPIKTEEQARRVNEMEEAIYGPPIIDADYPVRPVMKTVLERHSNSMEKDIAAALGYDVRTAYGDY